MEARKINSLYRDTLKQAAPTATSVRRILYGNNNYHTGIKDVTITAGSSLHEPELKRLTDMKMHFSSLASGNSHRPHFLFDKARASVKALAQYLKLK